MKFMQQFHVCEYESCDNVFLILKQFDLSSSLRKRHTKIRMNVCKKGSCCIFCSYPSLATWLSLLYILNCILQIQFLLLESVSSRLCNCQTVSQSSKLSLQKNKISILDTPYYLHLKLEHAKLRLRRCLDRHLTILIFYW